jgi:hypothetical protein
MNDMTPEEREVMAYAHGLMDGENVLNLPLIPGDIESPALWGLLIIGPLRGLFEDDEGALAAARERLAELEDQA